MRHSFGPYVLDEDARELLLRGAPVAIQPRVFDLLVHLVRNAGRAVPKDELMDTLWPDVIVTEASLHRLASLARRALDPGGAGSAIRSVARHGYRFSTDQLDIATGTSAESAAGGHSDTPSKPRLAAILAAGVVGSGTWARRDGGGAVRTVKGHINAFEPHLALHHGRVVRNMGDGFLAEFPSVLEAVACAVALQKIAVERNQRLGSADRAMFRIGVHAGDVIEDDGDISGDSVDIASCLEDMAAPGAIAVSASVFEDVNGRLDLAFRDRGRRTLNSVQRPLKVFEIEIGVAAIPRRPRPELPDKPSIAILPLKALSGNAEDEFLADGLTDDLTTALSSVPWLFVIARNSAFTYKGLAMDIRRIGRELGVRYIVEGSVRRSGEHVRISARLADAADGRQIWADRYDGELGDVFDLQDRIVGEVVRAVAPRVQSAEIRKSTRKRPDDRTSYDLYLNALGHLRCARITEARTLLRKAIEVYPDFAGARAILAWCTTLQVAWQSPEEHRKLREEGAGLCREALESMQRDLETEAYAGYSLAFHMLDVQRGMELVAHAVEDCPSFAWAWTSRSFLESFFGDPRRGLEFGERAFRLNPRDPLIFRTFHALATAYAGLGDYQKALEIAEEGLKHNSNIFALKLQKISALARMRRLDEARAEARKLLGAQPGFRIAGFQSYRGKFQGSSDMIHDFRVSGLPE
ncbi:winged helix-turn-helix domain-containing protein [Amaricoccus solimangrovi]|uniref:winged helix-turn-helix domain-containing protein n=1 Tax=Amaricoccus solimangrovi TaxID=2589815 RepID=UPI0015E46306|nr:winged helix-turn-helix domain-containing protein [Amaricoccus solimangrovi]